MIAWGADVSSSHKEYQNILKDYQQNLVICSRIGVEITWNFVLNYLHKRSLWQVERWRAFKESKRKP